MLHDLHAHPAEGGAPPPDLRALRLEIDRLDDALIALMESRLAAAAALADAKGAASGGALLLHPDREQAVLDRVAARSAPLPPATIAIIWRELMALSLNAQQRIELVVHAPHQPIRIASEVRLRFGCVAPIIVAGSADEALDRARDRDAIAIIELSPLSGWWVALADDSVLAAFAAIGDDPERPAALAIGRIARHCLDREISFPILSEAALLRRTLAGEAIRPLALCGHLRLCIARPAAAPR